MGREVRMVPPDWQHPIDYKTRRHVPLYDDSFATALADWERERAEFEAGRWSDGEPLPDSAKGLTFAEWNGPKPEASDYMPDWPEATRTHFQMYETTSEGTPISPVFATREEVARWCADNNASAFGDMTMSYEEWLAVAGGKPTVGAMLEPTTGRMWPA